MPPNVRPMCRLSLDDKSNVSFVERVAPPESKNVGIASCHGIRNDPEFPTWKASAPSSSTNVTRESSRAPNCTTTARWNDKIGAFVEVWGVGVEVDLGKEITDVNKEKHQLNPTLQPESK